MKSSSPDLGRVVDDDRKSVARRVLVGELTIERIPNGRTCLAAFQFELEVFGEGAAGFRIPDFWSKPASSGLIRLSWRRAGEVAIRVLCTWNGAVGCVGEL